MRGIRFSMGRLARMLATGTALAALLVATAGPATAAQQDSASGNIVYQAQPPHAFAFAKAPEAAFPTPSQCVQVYGFACYTPSEIRSAYGIPNGATGAGQTVVIVDAFGSPTIRDDLHTFDLAFGLPDPLLNIVYPAGKPTFHASDANMVGWAEETELDVEWAHAIAPEAAITLVVASTNYGNALNVAERYAVDNHLGSVMTMSFGAPEAAIAGGGNNLQLQQAHAIYEEARTEGITVFASSGDGGAGNGSGVANASFPASDPLVTAVGGTNLFMTDNAAYSGETVWNDADPDLCPFGCIAGPIGATGGAPSRIFAAPDYQAALSGNSMRTTSDVGYNASVYTAVLVYMSVPGTDAGFYFFGGTSEGAPQWAGITALLNERAGHAVGFLNPRLYAIASDRHAYGTAFHDVTIGQNGFNGPGFPAGPGYDLPTGLGSPNVAGLMKVLYGGGSSGGGSGHGPKS